MAKGAGRQAWAPAVNVGAQARAVYQEQKRGAGPAAPTYRSGTPDGTQMLPELSVTSFNLHVDHYAQITDKQTEAG